MIKRALIFMAAAAMLAACTKEPVEQGGGNGGNISANTEIYKTMADNYLYNEGFPPSGLDYNKSTDFFFNSLLSASPAHNDGKHPGINGDDYFYSYLVHTTKTKGSVDPSSYGFGYIGYSFNNNSFYMLRILYIVKDSAADKAGLKRGEWISEINGATVSPSNINSFNGGGAVTFTVGIYDMDSNGDLKRLSERKVPVGASTAIDIPSVHTTRIITTPRGDKIGYFHYLSFDTGPAAEGYKPTNGTYMKAMQDAFAQFKAAGVTDMVVDIRYNPGGYVECCRQLSSMIADRSALGKLFVNMKRNKSRGTDSYNFQSTGEVPQNLNMDRVYVLTSDWTASSSELLISALRPYMAVRIIGTTTEGKNVGSNAYTLSKYNLELHPITFQSYNADGESDNYKNGFTPDTFADDLDNLSKMKDLGDPEEYLLGIAIGEITGTGSMSARTKGMRRMDFTTIRPEGRPRISGAIVMD